MKMLIAIFGGAIVDKNGIWQTVESTDEGDQNGVTQCRFRTVAASVLYKKNLGKPILLAQGGLKEGARPSIASVIREELIALGVDQHHIILEENSRSTYTQLIELQRVIDKEHPNNVFIVSNEWHLPRIEAMIRCVSDFKSLRQVAPKLCAAEEILLEEAKEEWQEKVQKARQNDALTDRLAKEKQGIKEIEAGIYKYK